ncbi:thiamine ABC transporter ATP-binding protein ThiQ [Moellerella wisconsensis]|uniref:ATP-binding component of an ABC superfamily thiamine transporter n=1 Tax=Moellerella wisconsensis ATCC 35017 TaxID=1354267 RepID=A0A0N0IC58_9GAMM|nr:thiamine ABC transporter ATP-binding protein ThiQ [Moellerella wisconsensis]KPD04400.1 ATP-binding component of an ABC superfamily thiamine transporter [Moellerella wisconsensis ATCC 35017]VFS52680.1 Thiamine import ATP-binding protein ThiQ [Moellerella wisconsensis]
MIKLENLNYFYQNLAMYFNFTAKAGERIAILGPSGAGKSTLLSLISGFQYAAQGSIWLNGVDHTSTAPAQRPVSMLFQENNLFSHLTVRQNISLGANPSLRLSQQQQAEVIKISQQVGLIDYLDRLPSQLSGGQRQRAAVARCLIRQQPILLLDEPFSALDPALRNEMLGLLEEICHSRQLTLLMVSHSLEDAAQIAPRSLVIAEGTLAYDGSTQALIRGEVAQSALLGVHPNTE